VYIVVAEVDFKINGTAAAVNVALVAAIDEANVAAPVDAILNRLAELVAKSNVFAADKYIPFVGTVAPLGMNAVAVADEAKVAAPPDAMVNLTWSITVPLVVAPPPVNLCLIAKLSLPSTKLSQKNLL
jgi:hypothetical protein